MVLPGNFMLHSFFRSSMPVLFYAYNYFSQLLSFLCELVFFSLSKTILVHPCSYNIGERGEERERGETWKEKRSERELKSEEKRKETKGGERLERKRRSETGEEEEERDKRGRGGERRKVNREEEEERER